MAKRRNGPGEGSIARYKDGRWCARYTFYTLEGRAVRKAFYGRTKQEALDKRNRALAEYHNGLMTFNAEKKTVGEYLGRWLSDSMKPRVKAMTFESYSLQIHRHVVPVLGRLKLAKLSADHLQGLYRRKLDEGLSPRTVAYLHVLIEQALKQAHRRRLVPLNVAELVDPPSQQRKEMKYLSPEQARLLLRTARGDRLEALYALAVTAGLRQGELLGLKWEDVDLEARTLSVRRTLSAAKDGPTFTEPKSAASRRRIALTEGMVENLKRHRKRQLEERTMVGAMWRDEDLVFCSVVGWASPASTDTFTLRDASFYYSILLEVGGAPVAQ